MYASYTAHFITDLPDISVSVDDGVSISETIHAPLLQFVGDTETIVEFVGIRGPDQQVAETIQIIETVHSVLGITADINDVVQISDNAEEVLGFPVQVADTSQVLENAHAVLAFSIQTGNAVFTLFFRRKNAPWLE